MSSHYIEEYLVSLGFDLDSEDGKKYIDTLKDIEKHQKDAEKSGKSADGQAKKDHANSKQKIDDGKKEINLMGDFEKTLRQIGGLTADMGEGNVFGSLIRGGAAVKNLTDFINNLGDAYENTGSRAERGAPSGAGRSHQGSNYTEAAETARGAQAGAVEERGLQAGVDGAVPGEAAGAGGAIGGVAAIAGVAAVAAALIAGASAAEMMANNLANAQVNVETMSRTLWITDSNAWALNNTLNAMGKNIGDLNSIAINPELRKQYETLMDYQKQMLQMPADFQAVNDKWFQNVSTSKAELKEASNYAKQMAAYDWEKFWEPVATGWNKFWTEFEKGIGDELKGSDYSNTSAAKTPIAASSAPAYSASMFAPSASMYTTNNTTAPNVQFGDIVVNAPSGDPQAVGQAVEGAIAKNYGYAFATRSMQTQNR